MSKFVTLVQITKNSQQGWDEYKNTTIERCEAKTLEESKNKADKLAKEYNSRESVGDFGIVLTSYSAKVLHTELVKIL